MEFYERVSGARMHAWRDYVFRIIKINYYFIIMENYPAVFKLFAFSFFIGIKAWIIFFVLLTLW